MAAEAEAPEFSPSRARLGTAFRWRGQPKWHLTDFQLIQLLHCTIRDFRQRHVLAQGVMAA
jgi:hypothetical protein